MSSHTDSSISALSPRACQQSPGAGRDSTSLASLTVRCCRATLPNGRTEFADLLRDKSSHFTNNLAKLLKIGALSLSLSLSFFLITSARCAAEAEEERTHKRGHRREELGGICGVESTNGGTSCRPQTHL